MYLKNVKWGLDEQDKENIAQGVYEEIKLKEIKHTTYKICIFNNGKSAHLYNKERVLIYEGGINKLNQLHGKGTLYYEDVLIKNYEGNFKNDQIHGKGTSYRKDGTKKHEGDYVVGKRECQGIRYLKNGITKKYEGDYVEGKREGQGIIYRKNGITKKHDGGFKNGMRDGMGVRYHENGMKSTCGEFKDGKVNGYGIRYSRDGAKICEGNWVDSYPFGKCKFYRYFRDMSQLHAMDEFSRSAKGHTKGPKSIKITGKSLHYYHCNGMLTIVKCWDKENQNRNYIRNFGVIKRPDGTISEVHTEAGCVMTEEEANTREHINDHAVYDEYRVMRRYHQYNLLQN